ncbi:MAG: LamG-like jellyroll fold domain-containing protein [Akkermansiaceae bacterium]
MIKKINKALSFLVVIITPLLSLSYGQYEDETAQILAFGTDPEMLTSPNIYEVELDSDGVPTYGARYTPQAGDLKTIFYDALDTEGNPTRVFAWINIPANATRANPVPGVVLVHGGGGTAFQGWAEQWAARGYAAIAITTEGHTNIRYNAEVHPATTTRTPSGYIKHELSGPSRNFYSVRADLSAEWMYHATANTILANSLLRDLDIVDEDKVGVMGVSWGGVITSTAIGIDDRFAFAIPVYGCGHKFSSSNQYGSRLGNNAKYNLLWDPFLRIDRATMPSLWLSWPQDNHFPMDSQAYTYNKHGGEYSVSIVHGMGHSNGAAQGRPEPIDYADSIVETGAPWSTQKSFNTSGSEATVVFNSTKDLHTARLLWTADFDLTTTNNSNNRAWTNEQISDPVDNGDGTFTVTATIPDNATAYFINAEANSSDGETLIISSDHQELFEVTLSPNDSLQIEHPGELTEFSSGIINVSIDGPGNLPITNIRFINATHAGAFSVDVTSFLISENIPATTPIEVKFDNTVAQLSPGQSSVATMRVFYELTDGSIYAENVEVVASIESDGLGSLKANWFMDGSSGTQVTDSSGNAYHGILENGEWSCGIIHGAIDLTGGNAQITLPANAFSDVANEISLSMWVKGSANQPTIDTVFSAYDAEGNRVLNIHLPFGNSTVYWDAGNNGGALYDRINKAADSADFSGGWNHWVFTKNADSGVMNIYLNGSLWHTGSGNTRPMSYITSAFLGSAGGLSGTYDGLIDEVRMYNYELSAEEVSNLTSSILYQESLVADWSFDEASGTQVSDHSGNANNLSIASSARSDGFSGGGMEFNGDSTEVSLPTSAFSEVSDAISIAMWVYGGEAQPRSDSTFRAYDSDGNRVMNIHLPWSNSAIIWDAGNNGASYDRINKSASDANFKGQWNHWVFTKDVSNQEMRIYLNGTLWHSATGLSRPLNTIASAFLGSGGGTDYYDGLLDEVQIFNSALNAAEISNLYNRLRSHSCSSPLSLWLASHGSDFVTSTEVNENGDADGDGYNNLYEYAFGGDPNVNEGIMAIADVGKNTIKVYRRVEENTGLTYQIQQSPNLETWNPVATSVANTTLSEDGSFEEVEISRSNGQAWGNGVRHFLRVHATYEE